MYNLVEIPALWEFLDYRYSSRQP